MARHHLDAHRRLAALETQLAELGSVAVAFSGGADSAFLLAAAVRALGPEHVVAATAVSPSLPPGSSTRRSAFAARPRGPARDGDDRRAGPRGLPGQRGRPLYRCKSELLDTLLPVARARHEPMS